jgi:hypothetical protein
MSEVPWPWRAIDPSDREVCQQLGVPPETLTEFRRPQGVWHETLSDEFDLFACWWTDAIGRRHWYADMIHDRDRQLSDAHPLEWFASLGSFVLREDGGVREWLAVCRCGVVGPPEKIAWMGAMCGPCHDREQEGLPPLGLSEAVRTATGIQPLPCGGLLTLEWPVSLDESAEPPVAVRRFDSPDAPAPRWQIETTNYVDMIDFGCRCLVQSANGLQWLAPETGELRPAHLTDEPVRCVAARDGHLWIATARHLLGYKEDGPGEPRLLARLRRKHSNKVRLMPAPGGERVLIHQGDRMEVLDPVRNQVILTHQPCTRPPWFSYVWMPSGDLIGAGAVNEPEILLRWRGLAGWEAHGWLSRLLGASHAPERIVCPDRRGWLLLDADGRLLTWMRGWLSLHDSQTLQETHRFSRGMGDRLTTPTFSPDGDAFVYTYDGLVVWPWREMTR